MPPQKDQCRSQGCWESGNIHARLQCYNIYFQQDQRKSAQSPNACTVSVACGQKIQSLASAGDVAVHTALHTAIEGLQLHPCGVWDTESWGRIWGSVAQALKQNKGAHTEFEIGKEKVRGSAQSV